jgi:transcription termination factor Rho
MILAPGSLPTDDLLNQEIQALETELTGKKAVKREDLDVAGMHRLGAEEMIKLARAEGLEEQAGMPKQKLAFEILKARANKHGLMTATGTLEIMNEGFGFLRSAEYSYMDSPDDIYVSALHIRKLGLRKGQVLTGLVRAPKDTEVFFTMLHIDLVNGKPLTALRDLPTFEALTPLHPDKRIHLEMVGQPTKLETRIIDMVTPLGFGQRGLIVAPPRTGKTVILQQITNAICVNHPDVHVIVLLIDERPEEVTDFRRNTPPRVEVIASTFDEEVARHIQVAEMVMEKARRMVEFGQHVVILLDSITRLARGYNNGMSGLSLIHI